LCRDDKKYYGQHSNLTFNQYAISDNNGKTLLQIGRNSEETDCGKILEADRFLKS
jgi:hypothetical protein